MTESYTKGSKQVRDGYGYMAVNCIQPCVTSPDDLASARSGSNCMLMVTLRSARRSKRGDHTERFMIISGVHV